MAAVIDTDCNDEYWLTSDEIVNLLIDHFDGRAGIFFHFGNESPPDPEHWDQHDGTYPNWTHDCGAGKHRHSAPSLANAPMEPEKLVGEGEEGHLIRGWDIRPGREPRETAWWASRRGMEEIPPSPKPDDSCSSYDEGKQEGEWECAPVAIRDRRIIWDWVDTTKDGGEEESVWCPCADCWREGGHGPKDF
jgi:hypothetical protein